MGVNIEKRITKLEQEIKALKATYSIYGGLMKTYITSGYWESPSATWNFCIRFIPDYPTDKNIIISSMRLEATIDGQQISYNDNYISIQNGEGYVDLNFGIIVDESIFIQIAATVPGTFTRIS